MVRKFKTEAEKREHVIKINLARRHLEPYEWGVAFKKLLVEKGVARRKGKNQVDQKATIALCSTERGVVRGKGKTNQHTAKATIAQAATELGVPERTAKHRLSQADKFEALPLKTQATFLSSHHHHDG